VCRQVCMQLVDHLYCKVSSIEHKTVLGTASLVCKLSKVGQYCRRCAVRPYFECDDCQTYRKAQQWFSPTSPAYAWTEIVVNLTSLPNQDCSVQPNQPI
jgi:hypothetical protein